MLSRSSTNELQPQLPPSFKNGTELLKKSRHSSVKHHIFILDFADCTVGHSTCPFYRKHVGSTKEISFSFSQNTDGIGDTVDTFTVCSRSDLSLQRAAKFPLLTINAHQLQSHYFIKSCKMVVLEFHHSNLLTGILRRYNSLHEVQGYAEIRLMPKCRRNASYFEFSACELLCMVSNSEP